MKNLTKTLLALVSVGLINCTVFTQQAQAASITGGITFVGSVNLNTNSAGTATAVTQWLGPFGFGTPQVSGADGSFASAGVTPGMSATFTAPWSFNSGPIAAFWSVGGFTFNLLFSTVVTQVVGPPGSVTVRGNGMITGNGFMDTLGTWEFTTQDPGTGTPARFSFSAATGAIPEGGATVALLGLGLAGIEVLRRKTRKAA